MSARSHRLRMEQQQRDKERRATANQEIARLETKIREYEAVEPTDPKYFGTQCFALPALRDDLRHEREMSAKLSGGIGD